MLTALQRVGCVCRAEILHTAMLLLPPPPATPAEPICAMAISAQAVVLGSSDLLQRIFSHLSLEQK